MDKKFEYIARTLSRTKRKEYENYVVNAIWNRLNTMEVKPVSQQYIKHKSGYYLIDLYFPQLNIGIECDEGYHKQKVEQDIHREITIFDILKQVKNISEYQALHVDVTRSYAEKEEEINYHVQTNVCANHRSGFQILCRILFSVLDQPRRWILCISGLMRRRVYYALHRLCRSFFSARTAVHNFLYKALCIKVVEVHRRSADAAVYHSFEREFLRW